MGLIPSITTFTDGQTLTAALLNGVLQAIRNTLNASGAFIDVAREWTAGQVFSAGVVITDDDTVLTVASDASNAARDVATFLNGSVGDDAEAQLTVSTSTVISRMAAVNDPNGPGLYLGTVSEHAVYVLVAGAFAATFDKGAVADDTGFVLWDRSANMLVRVTRGAANSGGAGKRLLVIPN